MLYWQRNINRCSTIGRAVARRIRSLSERSHYSFTLEGGIACADQQRKKRLCPPSAYQMMMMILWHLFPDELLIKRNVDLASMNKEMNNCLWFQLRAGQIPKQLPWLKKESRPSALCRWGRIIESKPTVTYLALMADLKISSAGVYALTQLITNIGSHPSTRKLLLMSEA